MTLREMNDVPSSDGRSALVVEGGGMRGVFSAGVLDCFHEHAFAPFDMYFGVSAGACNLASHLGSQPGRNYRCYTEHMRNPEFFSLRKYLRGGHFMDLDWFWEHMAQVEPLDTVRAARHEFFVGVTRVATGGAEYLRARPDSLLEVLKSSCMVPLMYRDFIAVDGIEYTDGGVADPIPVEEACRRGARRIMVLRSQTSGYSKRSFVESRCIPLLFARHRALRRALETRGARYNDVVGFIKHPPADTEIVEICPESFRTKRTTTDRDVLEADYQEGRRAGLAAMARWAGPDHR